MTTRVPVREEEYKKISVLEVHHWWYRVLHERTISAINNQFDSKKISILDAGCGTGGLLKKLEESGYMDLFGTDISSFALEMAKKKSSAELIQADLRDLFTTGKNEMYDAIVFNDVLCYFFEKEIKTILQQAVPCLRKNGVLIINYPSGKLFSGNHDAAVGIKKRLLRGRFLKLLPERLVCVESVYWPFLLSPAIAAARKTQLLFGREAKSDLKSVSNPANELFFSITSCEKKYFPYAPLGSSLFLVAKKM